MNNIPEIKLDVPSINKPADSSQRFVNIQNLGILFIFCKNIDFILQFSQYNYTPNCYSNMADNKATEIPKDPYCDDDNPTVVNFERISAAAYRIHGGVVKTPCDVSSI